MGKSDGALCNTVLSTILNPLQSRGCKLTRGDPVPDNENDSRLQGKSNYQHLRDLGFHLVQREQNGRDWIQTFKIAKCLTNIQANDLFQFVSVME